MCYTLPNPHVSASLTGVEELQARKKLQIKNLVYFAVADVSYLLAYAEGLLLLPE